MERIFELLGGSPDPTPPHRAKSPAPPAMRTRLYQLCCGSLTAASLVGRTPGVRPVHILHTQSCCSESLRAYNRPEHHKAVL